MNKHKDSAVDPMSLTSKEEDKQQVSGKEITYDFDSYEGLPRTTYHSYEGLPTLGKWIKWNNTQDGSYSKGWVKEYTTRSTIRFRLRSDGCEYADGIDNKKGVLVEHFSGVCVTILPPPDTIWSYCDKPGEEEKDKAEWEGLNGKIGGRFCNKCNCVNKKLQICKGCFKVYYCDETCQLDNWNTHKADCKREKTVLKPDPRYPLSEVSSDVKKCQIRRQTEHHQILKDALNGNFTVKRRPAWNDTLRRREEDVFVKQWNPKSGDLEHGVEYELEVANGRQTEFEWEGLEPKIHSIPEGNPTSCRLFHYMESYLFLDQEFMKGGLNFLAGSYQEIEIFWFMLINFNTYGTVAPFYGPCRCNPKNVKAQMPPEHRELRKKWNKFFKRAKADFNDVQCMYSTPHKCVSDADSESEKGCHNFVNCPFKHDVEVKKEKKKRPL